MSDCDCEACTSMFDDDDYSDSEVCSECGYIDCECCGDCGCYSCECGEGDGGMGTSPTPPWVKRLGREIDAKKARGKDWREVWPEVDNNIDPVQESASFYLLEGIAANAVFPTITVKPFTFPSAEVDKEFLKMLGMTKAQAKGIFRLRDKIVQAKRNDPTVKMADVAVAAEQRLDALVDKLDPILVNYCHMACAGELRHHVAFAQRRDTLHNNREQAWGDWRIIYEEVGVEAVMDMHELFMEFQGDAYGGPKWAMAAKVLYQRLTGKLGPNDKVNRKIFVDRVWTLEHNGGCLLNKINWAVKNGKHWSLSQIKYVLDAHANSDWFSLYRCAEPAVQALFRKYAELANEVLGTDKPYWLDKVLVVKPTSKVEQHGMSNVIGAMADVIPQDSTVAWDFSYAIKSSGRGWVKNTIQSTGRVPLMDFIANPKKFNLKQYGKNKGPIGQVYHIDWTFNCYIYNQSGWGIIARFVARPDFDQFYDTVTGDIKYDDMINMPFVVRFPEEILNRIPDTPPSPKPKAKKIGAYDIVMMDNYAGLAKDLFFEEIIAKPLVKAVPVAKKAKPTVKSVIDESLAKNYYGTDIKSVSNFSAWVDEIVHENEQVKQPTQLNEAELTKLLDGFKKIQEKDKLNKAMKNLISGSNS